MSTLEELSRTNPHDLADARDFSDHSVWSRLFRKYHIPLGKICRRIGVPSHDVDDVVQSIWVELSCKLESFVYNPELRFRGYLVWLCKKRSLDKLKQLKRSRLKSINTEALMAELDDHDDELPAELQQRLDFIESLQKVVQSDFLNDTWRAFQMITLEDRPLSEVVEILGKKPTAILNANQRVKQRLQEEAARRLPETS